MPIPLLYLPLKVPVRYDLVHPLADWLDDDSTQTTFDASNNGIDAPPSAWVLPKPTYSSVQCRSELLRIAALRNCMSESLQDSHKAALQAEMLRDCKDYHATLLTFEQEGFPTNFDDDGHTIQLTWRGAFGTKGQEQHSSLLWDRACTLWNVAALESAQAAFNSNESSKEGLKVAISNLQAAASHLSLCQQLVESLPEFTLSTVDLSKPMLQFWQKLFLAQAQVSIYKLANHKDAAVRNHTTLAYLIQGAAPLYNEALQYSQDPRLKSEVPQPCQEWAAHCKATSMLCQARAYFHASIAARVDKEHGLELARLQQTTQQLTELLQFCDSTAVLKEAVKLVSSKFKNDDTISPMAAAAATIQPEAEALQRLAQDRYNTALQDNRDIYMDDIPTTLTDIRPQTMVKTDLPLSDDMIQPRAKLFAWK
ncbi:BRO1-like domain containing protein [Nitzschia inconspicua]|uniref:BRO1-like domain containing protein n=1 Tax=Nitzschia inconspicua TaxID=303405 RepID=A0A9K3PDP8_9STRA|nr:BRO1-like domain containing protein [Nitzschia inconspicua]